MAYAYIGARSRTCSAADAKLGGSLRKWQGRCTWLMLEEHKLGIEEAARICRYLFLLSLAEARGAAGVAVGLTADDQG